MLTAPILLSLQLMAQAPDTEALAAEWKPAYWLPQPAGWDVEHFPIPIPFAPEIHYNGMEDLRFAPGWGEAASDEYWTYIFLWYLDGKQEVDADILSANLSAYYNGLIGSNVQRRNIPPEKISPVKSAVKKIKTETGDVATYTGAIEMLDYMQQLPITLNCKVHLKKCGEDNKTFLLYQLSPKPFTHTVWEPLNQIVKDFECKAGNREK